MMNNNGGYDFYPSFERHIKTDIGTFPVRLAEQVQLFYACMVIHKHMPSITK